MQNSDTIEGLYIHIPFCRRKCLYCDFISWTPYHESEIEEYVELLKAEFLLWKEKFDPTALKTIYIGGGTPSILKPQHIEDIIKEWAHSGIKEITVEANPESLSEDFLKSLLNAGVTRLSIGVQTLDEKLLKTLGRLHSARRAIEALELAKKYPFSISADLLMGIPGQTTGGFMKDLQAVLEYQPHHLSAYILQPSEKTPIFKKMKMVKEEKVCDMYLRLCEIIKERGYLHYEISNFALPRHECLHNLNYWKGKFYAGCGPSASSHLPPLWTGDLPIRVKNFSGMEEYRNSVMHGSFPFEDIEEIDREKEISETLMLRLRTHEGIRTEELRKFLGEREISILKETGKNLGLEVDGEGIRFPEEKYLLFNSIVSSLLFALEKSLPSS